MKNLQLLLFPLLLGSAFSFCIFSCTKEFSCERCSIVAIDPPGDSTVVIDKFEIDSTIYFPFCDTCDSIDQTHTNSWSFKNYKSKVCGTIDTAYFSPDNHSFTFWGVSNCSGNIGFSISAFFLADSLNSNFSNISTKSLVLYVQDRPNYMDPWNGVILKNVGLSQSSMTLVIDSFISATRYMSGRFFGFADAKNKKSYVDGKFNLKVP